MTTQPEPTPPNPSDPAPNPTQGRALNNREIARATSIVMLAFILSGILGMVRQIVLAGKFGADVELDAFYAALRVPETLFTLVAGGALGSAFIPVFSGYITKDRYTDAWRLASSVLTLVVGAASLSALVGFIFAEPLVETLLVPKADAASQALTVELMRIMLVTVVIFGVSGLWMGILNAHQHFIAPALAPSMYNIGIIAGALIFEDVQGLAWGAVIGAGLHMLVQLPSLLKLPHRHLQILPNTQTEGVTQVLKLMGPRLLGLMVVQVNFWVNVALASGMTEGSLTALTTAFTLMFTVLGVLGQSLGTAVFPTLSALYAQGDMENFRRTLRSALENVLFLSIPAGMGMVILARPIVQVMFQRGEWTANDTHAAAWALVFYGIGLMGHAALEILARTYYALQNTWTPVLIGGSAMVLNVVLSLLFIEVFAALGADAYPRGSFAGLALANSLATAIESTILWLLLRRYVVGLDPRPILATLSRTLLAGVGMMAVVWGWLQLGTPLLIELVGGMGLGVLSFGGLAFALNISAARVVPNQLMRRFKK